MKKFNPIKIFLIMLIAITWGVVMNFAVFSYTQKEGYENYNTIVNSCPASVRFSVSCYEMSGSELSRMLEAEYGDDSRVMAVTQPYTEYDVDCEEWKKATGRDVTLRMEVNGKQYESCMEGKMEGEMGEVWVPKYFTPCNYGRYGDKNYIDGEEWIGKKITVTGHKAEYVKEEDSIRDTEDTCSMEMLVAGTYDNVKAGLEGNVLLYSEETFWGYSQKRLDMEEEQVKECLDKDGDTVYIYASGAQEKKELFEEMQKQYPDYSWDFSTGSVDDYDSENMLDTKKTIWKYALIALLMMTLAAVVITILLIKENAEIINMLSWFGFVAAVGLINGAVNAYRYAVKENRAALAKEDFMIRFLEYPLQPAYITFAAGAGLGIVSVILFVVNLKRVRIRKETAQQD